MRRALPLILGLLLAVSAAEAGGFKGGSLPALPGGAISGIQGGSIVPRVGPIVPHGRNIVPNPPPAVHHGAVHNGHRGHPRFHAPSVIFVPSPVYVVQRECVAPGRWEYQWIPVSYTQNVWVPGAWAPDGRWIDPHFEQQAYSSGYYQPYWVPGQAYAC